MVLFTFSSKANRAYAVLLEVTRLPSSLDGVEGLLRVRVDPTTYKGAITKRLLSPVMAIAGLILAVRLAYIIKKK